jgi:signal transduction histidine kinase
MGEGTASENFSRLLMVEEEEAKHIANELHHNLTQSLHMIDSDLGGTIQQLKNNQIGNGIEKIEAVILKIQEIANQIQMIGMHLRPDTLDSLGLLATISWLCREFQKTHSGFQIKTHTDIEENEVPRFLRYLIYKILQEALNNVVRYSKANLVQVFLSKRDAKIELTIEDNSEGFDMKREASADSKLALGFDSIRERAEIACGAFAIESVVGKGTIIRVSWPI